MIYFLTLLFAVPVRGQTNADWTERFPPHAVIGNVYYVGSKGLASYLFVAPQGNILLNSSLEASVPLIRESIEKLGFKFTDTKILLISHGHFDHCAGSALIKQLTGAKYMVMDEDVSEIEAGGKGNFRYGTSPETFYPPTKVAVCPSHARSHEGLYYLDNESCRTESGHNRQSQREPRLSTREQHRLSADSQGL
jgi:metallo-beta-lactamase class B